MSLVAAQPWLLRQCIQSLAALRNLPDGAKLYPPSRDLERSIFEDLLSLDGAVDPVEWLIQTRSKEVCVVYLLGIIDRISAMSCALVNETNRPTPIPHHIIEFATHVVNNLTSNDNLNQSIRAVRYSNLTKEDISSLLVSIATQLGQRLPPPEESQQDRGDNPFSLAHHILLHSKNSDPLLLIESKYIRFAAMETLYQITSGCLPHTPFLAPSSEIYSKKINYVWDDGIIKVYMHEIALGTNGFAITLQVRLPKFGVTTSGQQFIRWSGIESLSDDRGQSYLVDYQMQDLSLHRGHWLEKAKLYGYPALPKAVERVSWKAMNVTLWTTEKNSQDPMNIISYENITSIIGTISMPVH